jgi:hypothetical protein
MDYMLPELSLELTMEQSFQMRIMEEQVQKLSPSQMQELLLQSSRLLMVKDNVIRSLLKKI